MALNSRLILVLSVAGALAIGAAAAWVLKPAAPEPLPPPILSMEKMGHLVAVRVNYSDVFEFTEKRTIDIPWTNYEWRLGGTTVLLVARGDCTVAANLSAAKYERKDDKARSLDVVLPLPQPLSARINHDAREKGGSYFYAITTQGIEPFIPASDGQRKAVNKALTRVQSDIERVCRQPQIISNAKQNTESVLRATFQATGWTPTFIWR
jgi:hypothetical protein